MHESRSVNIGENPNQSYTNKNYLNISQNSWLGWRLPSCISCLKYLACMIKMIINYNYHVPNLTSVSMETHWNIFGCLKLQIIRKWQNQEQMLIIIHLYLWTDIYVLLIRCLMDSGVGPINFIQWSSRFNIVRLRVSGIQKAMNNLTMFLWVFYEEFWMIISGCKRLLVLPLQHWKRF